MHSAPIRRREADVITDFDLESRRLPSAEDGAPRRPTVLMAIVHIAMFDAVNSIEPLYRPYYAEHPPAMGDTSKDAAAAAAAGAVLTQLRPDVCILNSGSLE